MKLYALAHIAVAGYLERGAPGGRDLRQVEAAASDLAGEIQEGETPVSAESQPKEIQQ